MTDDSTERPLWEVDGHPGSAQAYTIQVWPFLFGQFRIQLCANGDPSPVRQLCTYKMATAIAVTAALAKSEDPEAYCRSLERPWNFEAPGGRIRLDEGPESSDLRFMLEPD